MAVRVIDYPNNGGDSPGGAAPRVETGAVQFGNDWPGLFVRGDEAICLALYIGLLEPHLKALLETQRMSSVDRDHVDTALSTLSEIRRIIDEEVRLQ